MARPPAVIPAYRRHKANNRAFVYFGGRQHMLGVYGSPESRVAYARILSERAAALTAEGAARAAATSPVAAPVAHGAQVGQGTIERLIEAFWGHAVTYYSRIDPGGSGARVATPQLEHFRQICISLRCLYGPMRIMDFGCVQLEALRAAWALPAQWTRMDGSIAQHRPWCRTHINRQAGRLKAMFAWGVMHRIVPPAVHAELRLLPGLRKGQTAAPERAAVAPVDSSRALAVVPFVSRQVGVMIQLQLLTGMRSTELCIMRPMDIDRSQKPWRYVPAHHKTESHGIARIVRLGKKARALLRTFIKNRATDAYLFSPGEAEAERREKRRAARKTPVQPSQLARSAAAAPRVFSKGYNRSSYYHAIRAGCALAFGMPAELQFNRNDSADVLAAKAAQRSAWHAANSWHPHQARHRAATDLRRHGGLSAAQVQLGHAHQTTTEIYAQADVDSSASTVERVG